MMTVSELAVAALVHAAINLETAGLETAARFMSQLRQQQSKEIEVRMKQDRCTPGQEPFSPRQKSAEEAAATISETPDDGSSSDSDEEDAKTKGERRMEAKKLHDALSPTPKSTPRQRKRPQFFNPEPRFTTIADAQKSGKKRLINPMQPTSPSSDDEQKKFKRLRRKPAESQPAESPPAESPQPEAVNKHPSQ